MPPRRAPWTQENLRSAMAAVQRGQLTQRGAAERYNIPRRTLRNHLKSGNTMRCLGRRSIMTEAQECDLVNRIIRFANIGMPLTPKLIRRQAFIFCEKYELKHNFNADIGLAGKDWLKMFLKRHPEISKRKAQFMNPARAQKLNRPIVSQHFSEIQKIYDELEIITHPQRLYNIDEKGCRLTVHNQQTVLAQRGARRVHLIAPEHAQNVTIAMCVNAVGTAIPPMIIFKGQRQKPEFSDNLPAGSFVKMSAKGSMTTELFVEFIKHLAKYKTQGKILLIFDGASSHLDYTIVEEADRHDIVLYCLPSNTTHELQPLDKSVNKSFEHYWDQEVLRYMYQNPERRITKTSFNTIFTKVWSQCLTHDNIVNGFRATGLYPFNPDILPDEAFAPSILTELPPPTEPSALVGSNTDHPDNYTVNQPEEQLRNEDDSQSHLEQVPDLPEKSPAQSAMDLNNLSVLTNQEHEDTIQSSENILNDVETTPKKAQIIVTPTQSPKPSTSGLHRAPIYRRPIIYSSGSETDSETNIELQITQLALNKSSLAMDNIYGSEENIEDSDDFSSDDNVPLANLKDNKFRSPFQELLPTPNYAVTKNKPRRKAINYKGQRVTKDLFKEQETLKENKLTKKRKPKESKKTKNEKKKRSKGDKRKRSNLSVEESWFCPACNENRVSDMRQCVKCRIWYHEECLGLTKNDKDFFYCQNCDE